MRQLVIEFPILPAVLEEMRRNVHAE